MSDIATKLTYLDGTREKILTETNRLGVGLTEQDKFRDYAKGLHDGYVDVLNNGTDTLYDNMEKVTGEGSNITLNNVEEAPMRSEMYGDTTQDGTPTPTSPVPINVVSGRQTINIYQKNLFNKNGNITLDYRLTTDGFNYADNGYYISPYINVEPNTTYTKNSPTADWAHRVCFYSSDYPSSFISKSEDNTITTPSNCQYLRFCGLQTELDTTMLEKGNQATTYEEYKGNIYKIDLAGKNKFNYDDLANKIEGFNISGNQENFTISGNSITYLYPMVLEGQYTISGSWSTTNGNGNVAVVYDDDSIELLLGIYDDTSGSGTINFTANGSKNIKGIRFRTYGNKNFTFTNFMIEKGSQATSYSPYKTPIELCKINTYKDMIFRSEGVNLFDKDSGTDDTYIQTNGTEAGYNLSWKISDYISVEPNQKYTYSGLIDVGVSPSSAYYDINKTLISVFKQNTGTNTITIPNNAYYVRFSIKKTDLSTFMLNKGTTALPYEPYNSKGKWLLHKEIGKVVLDGSENWGSFSIEPSGLGRAIVSSSNVYYESNQNTIMASNMVGVRYSDSWNKTYDCISSYSNNRFIAYLKNASDLATFKSILNNSNAIVYYVLATPTTTEITDTELLTQLNNWYNQKSIEGETNISVTSEDLPAILNVVAIKNYE